MEPINNLVFKLISIDASVNSFDCGNPSINNYLKQSALFDFFERKGSTTLSFHSDEILGFFTLSREKIAQIDREGLIVQYLAVNNQHQDSGVGSQMIEHIVDVALKTNERYIFLQALKDDNLVLINWYNHRGFLILDEDEILDNMKDLVWMFIDLLDEESLRKLFEEP